MNWTITSAQEFLSLMRLYKDTFMDLYKLICISLILPVTPVTYECRFTCLSHLKNYLRNRSEDSWTRNLALFAMNTERERALDSNKIFDVFTVNHNIILLWKCYEEVHDCFLLLPVINSLSLSNDHSDNVRSIERNTVDSLGEMLVGGSMSLWYQRLRLKCIQTCIYCFLNVCCIIVWKLIFRGVIM